MTERTPKRAEVDRLVRREGIVAAGNRCNVAGILYTYRCTIACRHCCFGSSAARPDVRMTTEQVVRHLRSLHELGRAVHVAAWATWPFFAVSDLPQSKWNSFIFTGRHLTWLPASSLQTP